MARGPRFGPVLLVYLLIVVVILALPTNVLSAKEPPEGYTREVRVTYNAQGDYFPTMVVDEQNNVHMFWLNGTGGDLDNRQVTNGELYYAKYDRYGDLVVPPKKLQFGIEFPQDSGGDFYASPSSVALSQNHKIWVTWADSRSGTSVVYLIRLDLLGDVEYINGGITNATDAKYPDIAVDNEGNVHLTWAQWEYLGQKNLYPDIYYMKLNPAGSIIGQRVTVTNTWLASNHPALAVDQGLNAHIVFEENVNTPLATDQLYYCEVDPQGHLKISMQRVTSMNGASLRPDIAFDRNDLLHIVWEEDYLGMYTIYFTELKDPNNFDMLKVSNGPESAYDPRLIIDQGLNTHIVWTQDLYKVDQIVNSRIQYAEVGPDWEIVKAATFLSYGGLVARPPAFVVDGYSNMIVSWGDYRKDPRLGDEIWDIYYMRTVVGVNLPPDDRLQINGVNFTGGEIDKYVGDKVVFFAGNSSDPNGWDRIAGYNFTIVLNGNTTEFSGWTDNATLDYKFVEPGDYIFYVKVKDSFGLKNGNPKAVLIHVTEKKQPATVTILDNPRIRTTVLAGSIGFTATLGYLIAGTELGKYKFATLLLVPLYSRIKRENTLDNYIRGQIHGYILAKPGCHYNQIKLTLNLNNGTLAYHLRKLEREEFIKSVRDGMYKRFYPVGLKIPKREIKLSAMQERILEIIRHHPGISQKEVAGEVGISAPAVIYHIGVLAGAKLVRSDKVGSRMEYRALERPEDEWELPADKVPAGTGH